MICPGTIQKGSTDVVSVKAVKVRLNDLLGSSLDIHNGNFGESTELVVKQFQKAYNLLADGIVGELTWKRLFTVAQKPKPSSTELRFRALEIMKTQLFVREKTGNNDGVEVEKFLKSVGLGKGYAWCVAFGFWGYSTAAQELKIPNVMPKTAGALDCLAKSKKYIVTDPQKGDIGIMDFGGGKGHWFAVDERDGMYVETVEGNTSADPSYKAADREGNGVFERRRPVSCAKAYLRFI